MGPATTDGVRARCMATIQSRGDWKAQSSVRRYEKHGRITIQLRKLPAQVLHKLVSLHALGSEPFAERCALLLDRAGVK